MHLESYKQNYYIISLRAIIKAIFTNDDKGWGWPGWAAGRRRRNLAWIWISQHLNGTSRKRCPCAKWPLEQVIYQVSPSQRRVNVDGNVEKSLRNIFPLFPLVLGDQGEIEKFIIRQPPIGEKDEYSLVPWVLYLEFGTSGLVPGTMVLWYQLRVDLNPLKKTATSS